MDRTSRGSQTKKLEEEIGSDEHSQGDNDDDLQRNAFWLIRLIDVAADFGFGSSHRGRSPMVSPSRTAWLATGLFLGFWTRHISQQAPQPINLCRRLGQPFIEVLLSRRRRCWLTRLRMMDGDIHDRCRLHILARFFERCVVSGLVEVWNRRCATTVGHACGVEFLSRVEL